MARALIIGSNRGIGLELCKQLAGRGDTVIAACRKTSDQLDSVSGIEVHADVDVTDRKTVAALATKVGKDSVDLLIVVAGILQNVSLDDFNVETIRRQLEVNAIGPLQTSVDLLGCMKRGSKIGWLTSRMGSIADNTSGGSYGYRMSKAALNMAGCSLAQDLRPKEIALRLLHPGWVQTEMTGNTGHLNAADSAAGLIDRLDELTMETSGSFVHQNGESLPW